MRIVVFLITILSFSWCQAQRNYHDDDVVDIVKKWYQNEAPYDWPINTRFISIKDISEIRDVNEKVADSIILMTIRLGKEVPDSTRFDTVSLG